MNKILAILAFAILTLYAYNGNYDVAESDVNIKEVPLDYKFSSFANIIPHTEDQTFVIEKEWIKKFSYSEDGYISTLSKSEEVVFNDDTIEFKFNANLDNGYGCKDTITINYTGKKLSDSSSCSYGVSYITNKDDINLTTENNITFNIKTVDSQLVTTK